MYRNVLSSFSHLNRDPLKSRIRRAVSIVLMLVLTGGSGSTMFARSLVESVSALNEQRTRLSQFVPVVTSKPYAAAQEILEDRGMPPNPPASAAIRPEPPQTRSVREARAPVSC
jgi:septin family protein